MKQRQFRLIANWKCLSRGTVLNQDHDGNYFVYMEVEEWAAGHFINRYIGLSGALVESRPDIFEEITVAEYSP